MKKLTSLLLAVLLTFSMLSVANVSVSATVLEDGTYTPTDPDTETNRYYFYMPTSWYANDDVDSAGIYWWAGTDACGALDGSGNSVSWPGYKAYADETYDQLFYCDVPTDVEAFVWDNYLDGGADTTADVFYQAKQTINVNCTYYAADFSDNYDQDFFDDVQAMLDTYTADELAEISPYYSNFFVETDWGDGLSFTFDNMIYIIDPSLTKESTITPGKYTYGGEWYFYYGDGTCGDKLTRAEAEEAGTLISLADIASADEAANVASADEATESTTTTNPKPDYEIDTENNRIYFDLDSSGWNNVKTVYCHIWAVDGTGDWPAWQTKAERCTDNGDGRWYYDLSQTGNEISASDGTIYSVIFSANTGMQTYNLLMNGACIGDTAYCTGEEIENPEDSEKTAIVAAWVNNSDCGPEKRITSTGNIVGTSYADGEDDTTLLAAYAVSYYNDSAKLAYIPSLLEQLNVTLDDLYAGIESKLNKSVSEESMSAEYAESILAEIKSALEEDDSSDTPVEDDTDENEEPEYLYCGDYAYTVLEDGTAQIAFYIGNETEIVIPATLDGYTVTSIGEKAFDYYGVNNYIVSIEIPDTVTTICDEAFGYIYNLEEIILPESVKSIGVYAFVSCDKLTSVIIPDSVETVGERAFYNCESLTSVQIASSVTNIGDCAFGYHYYTDITGKYSITYDDFTIYGYTGTAAETYANNNEIAFVSLGAVETEPVIGDADGNGIINIADVTVVQKAAVHLVVLSDEETALADADGDGRVSVLDATCIQKFVVGGYSDTGLTGQKVEG